MIASILRRVLAWSAGLGAITLVTFGILSGASRERRALDLPLFFNPEPGKVERLARESVQILSRGEGDQGESAALLARLGGAALPYVLPELDSLSPEGRERVAAALEPVRRRMGFAPTSGGEEAGSATLFWARFWEEHAIDFRPVVAERAAARLAQRSSPLRVAEVRRLDTFCLDALSHAVGEVETGRDVPRVERLAARIAAMVELDELRPDLPMNRESARDWVQRFGTWWARHRSLYRTYLGLPRITAMLRETRYGAWLAEATKLHFGRAPDGQPVLGEMRRAATVTIPLLLCCALGLGSAALARRFAARRRRGPLRVPRRGLRIGEQLARATPPALAVVVLEQASGDRDRAWLAALGLSLLAGASAQLVGPLLWGRGPLALDEGRRAPGRGREPGARRLAWVGAQGSLLTFIFVVEAVLGLPGLGARTLLALQRGETEWMMAFTLVLFAWVVGGQLLGEAVAAARQLPSLSWKARVRA